MKAQPIGGKRWVIQDGNDLVTVWLSADGFHSQRISNYNTPQEIGRDQKTIPHEDLILASEGQRKLL